MTNPSLAPASIQRFLSLDVVRGITIAFMIMVNNNGGPGSWHFMNHAEWNGLTPTDLVFPTFVFVIGVCYLVVSVFYLWDSRAWTKVVALVGALVGYWFLLRWVPVPGAGMAGRDIPFMDMTQNLVSWIDRHVFP